MQKFRCHGGWDHWKPVFCFIVATSASLAGTADGQTDGARSPQKAAVAELDANTRKRLRTCQEVASNEYYIRIAPQTFKPMQSVRIEFSLPNSGGGRVPCAALMIGLEPTIQDSAANERAATTKEFTLTTEAPGSEGPATYRQTVATKNWTQPAFMLPIGPGDDTASGKWAIVLNNNSKSKLRTQAAFIRMLLRFD